MCLLVLQKKKATIGEDSLENAFDNNPDGVGYSYIENKKVVTKKYRKYKKFLNSWKEDNKRLNKISPFLLHFRLATHGIEEGTFNVHPFNVRDGLVFAHNGIINDVEDDKKLSDTQVFNRDILTRLERNFLDNAILLKLIEGFIGSSKLAFLNRDKSYKIVNEDAGDWIDNVWFSNTSHQYKGRSYSFNSKIYGSYGDYNWQDEYDDFNDISQEKAKDSIKQLRNGAMEQCGWCGNMVDKLTHTNVKDMYSDGEDRYLWMCDGCIEIEDEYTIEDKEDSNNNQIAIYPLGSN